MAVAVSKFSSKAQAIVGRARGVQINQPGNETIGLVHCGVPGQTLYGSDSDKEPQPRSYLGPVAGLRELERAQDGR